MHHSVKSVRKGRETRERFLIARTSTFSPVDEQLFNISRKSECKLKSLVNSFLLRRGKVAAAVLLFLIKTAGAKLNFLCVRGTEGESDAAVAGYEILSGEARTWKTRGRRKESLHFKGRDNGLIILKDASLLT